MSTDVEELLREGMERFTTGVHAPAGLAATAGRLRRRRRRAIQAAAACGTAAITAAAVVIAVAAGGTAAPAGGSTAQAHTVAYVVSRVKTALATENLVYYGKTTGTYGPSATWAYGQRWRWEEFTGAGCRNVTSTGDCTHRGGSVRYLATGTARAGGKLTTAYVTYYNREYSLSPITYPLPTSACSRTARLEMAGPAPTPGDRWSDFINATLACGAAKVTGHVRVNGQETIQITGKPLTTGLGRGEAHAVREKYVRVKWTLYVNPTTYLPVRITGSDATFGGPAASTFGSMVTNVQWLQPTPANRSKALVPIPPGFHRVSNPANQ
jgi:hypothetical protein